MRNNIEQTIFIISIIEAFGIGAIFTGVMFGAGANGSEQGLYKTTSVIDRVDLNWIRVNKS